MPCSGLAEAPLFSQVKPGETKTFTFLAMKPGLYIYHCGTSLMAQHMANGMYGMILIEPAGGLAAADREFYIMQGEIYTSGSLGDSGPQKQSLEKLLAERPDYFVFNGNVTALMQDHPLKAATGEKVRIFFGDAGPNFNSAFHVAGEILDRIWSTGSLTVPPETDVQTITVPPGSAAIAEFTPLYPGHYAVVDHALSRMARRQFGKRPFGSRVGVIWCVSKSVLAMVTIADFASPSSASAGLSSTATAAQVRMGMVVFFVIRFAASKAASRGIKASRFEPFGVKPAITGN
jgi:FtsP/CotA-like multicopper oxidase with cupredoxin domain